MDDVRGEGSTKAMTPTYTSFLPRVLEVTVVILLYRLLSSLLGGFALGVEKKADGGVDTSKLFNWHPLLMVFAYGVVMSEAAMAYRVWPLSNAMRPVRKKVHFALHSLALICIIFGLVAAFQSHNLAEPPIPNLYSVHSWLGLSTVILSGFQYLLGIGAYWLPWMSMKNRTILMPYHVFFGFTTYLMGLSTILLGIQEKATFLQTLGKKPVHGEILSIMASIAVLVAFLGIAVVFAVIGNRIKGLVVGEGKGGPNSERQLLGGDARSFGS